MVAYISGSCSLQSASLGLGHGKPATTIHTQRWLLFRTVRPRPQTYPIQILGTTKAGHRDATP